LLFKQKNFLANKIKLYFDRLNRPTKIMIAILIDSFCFLFSVWLSLSLFSGDQKGIFVDARSITEILISLSKIFNFASIISVIFFD